MGLQVHTYSPIFILTSILTNRFEELIEHFKNNPIIFEGNKIICSYSYGIVNFPVDGREFDELIKIADERMYEYKRMVKSKKA